MSAGAIRAPLVIPLRSPDSGLFKSRLDTGTYLEITCDTPDVAIYFTINGSKPTVLKCRKELLNTGTYKFVKPFTLPPGSHILRAVAVSLENGNESSVVTKTFDVVTAKTSRNGEKTEIVDDYGFLSELKSTDSKRRRQMSDTDRPDSRHPIHRFVEKDEKSVSEGDYSVVKKSIKDQENQVNLRNERILSVDNHNNNGSVKSPLISEHSQPSTHMVNRLQQQIDILRCPNCYHERPVSRKQNFCFHCGLGLPILSSPKHGSCALENIGVCPYCKAHVPLNLTSCLVCEAPLQRSQVQKYGQYPEECRLCTTCGTMNPIDARSCIICEVRLPMGATNVVLSKGQSFCDSHVPCLKEQQNKYTVMNKSVRFSLCVYCHRENNPDARYCDWCGIEVPKQSLNPLNSELKSSDNNGAHHDWSFYDNHNKTSVRYGFIHCIKCDLPNPKEANYCSYCGLNLLPPPRTGWYSTSHTSNYNEFESDGNQSEKSLSQYKPLQTVVANVSTQTVGLFYPSSTDLRRQARLTQSRLSADAQLRDKAPVLTAVSPGRGFWRKQLDHIFAHLKLYTNNNSEFRAAIGQPRFGKLLSADLCEASNQAKITLTYTLPSDKKTVTSGTGNQIISNKVSVDSDYNDGKLSHSMKYPNQSKQNLDSFKNLNRQENTYEQQLTARQSPAPCPVKDDQYEMMRSSPVQRGNTDINHIPPKSSHEYYENKSKTGSSEAEEDESKNVTKSTKSLNSTKKKPDHKYSGLRPNPHTQYGETGVALLRNSKLSTSDINLLYTLSQTNVDIHEVKRLLKEGANPNCVNGAKETPLICAVRHGHVQAISVLHENGAQINIPGTSLGNTPLHEAVLRGMDGLELAKELLRCGGNMKIENNRKETPHAIVLRSNYEPLIRLFSLYLGQKQLKELTEDTTNKTDSKLMNSSLDITPFI